jgi:pullulanase/glycogen debranching enzyme
VDRRHRFPAPDADLVLGSRVADSHRSAPDSHWEGRRDDVPNDNRGAARGVRKPRRAGDEYLRSLSCNNNPYDLDNVGNWLNYNFSADQTNFDNFAQRMIAFRNAHPALRSQTWYSSADNNGNGMVQLQWYAPAGSVVDPAYWNNPRNHAIAWQIDGTEFGDPASAIYIATTAGRAA